MGEELLGIVLIFAAAVLAGATRVAQGRASDGPDRRRAAASVVDAGARLNPQDMTTLALLLVGGGAVAVADLARP
jgi:hypothetical protein